MGKDQLRKESVKNYNEFIRGKVLLPGYNTDHPPVGSKLNIMYTTKSKSTGEIYQSCPINEGYDFFLRNIDEDGYFREPKAWHVALEKMGIGEKIELHCDKVDWKISGIGFDSGVSSEDVDLDDICWDIELQEFVYPPKDRLSRAMTFKDLGNTMFREKKYTDAYTEYFKAQRETEDLSSFPQELKSDARSLFATVTLNMASVQMVSGNWRNALDHTNRAISVDSKNGKAYFRRSEIHVKLENFSEALQDLLNCRTLLPTSKGLINKRIIAVRKKLKQQNQTDRKAFSSLFQEEPLKKNYPTTQDHNIPLPVIDLICDFVGFNVLNIGLACKDYHWVCENRYDRLCKMYGRYNEGLDKEPYNWKHLFLSLHNKDMRLRKLPSHLMCIWGESSGRFKSQPSFFENKFRQILPQDFDDSIWGEENKESYQYFKAACILSEYLPMEDATYLMGCSVKLGKRNKDPLSHLRDEILQIFREYTELDKTMTKWINSIDKWDDHIFLFLVKETGWPISDCLNIMMRSTYPHFSILPREDFDLGFFCDCGLECWTALQCKVVENEETFSKAFLMNS